MNIEEALKKLGYEYNEWTEEWKKRYEDLYCVAYIALEQDEEYKKERGLIHSAWVSSNFIISERKVITQIEKAFERLQEELKELEKYQYQY